MYIIVTYVQSSKNTPSCLNRRFRDFYVLKIGENKGVACEGRSRSSRNMHFLLIIEKQISFDL